MKKMLLGFALIVSCGIFSIKTYSQTSGCGNGSSCCYMIFESCMNGCPGYEGYCVNAGFTHGSDPCGCGDHVIQCQCNQQ